MDKKRKKELKAKFRQLVLQKELETEQPDWCHYSSSLYGEDTDHPRSEEDEIIGERQEAKYYGYGSHVYNEPTYEVVSIRKCSVCGKKYSSSELDPPCLIAGYA